MQEYAADFLNCENNPLSILNSMEKLEKKIVKISINFV